MKTSKEKKYTGIRKIGKKYYVNVQVNGVRFERKAGNDLKHAIELRNELKSLGCKNQFETAQNKMIEEKNESILLKDAVQIYKKERLSQIKSGYCTYHYFTRMVEAFGDVPINQIDYSLLNDFKSKRLKEVKKGTIRNNFSVLSTFYNWCIKKKWCNHNPVKEIELDKFDNTRNVIISHEEFLSFLSIEWFGDNRGVSTSYRLEHHVILALIISDSCAMRIGEVLNLKWDDIVQASNGKCFHIRESKGEKQRLVPIGEELKKILEYQNRTCDYIINYFNKPVKSLKKAFGSARSNSKVNFRIHDLRHRGTTRFVQENYPIPLIKKVTGHSSDSAFKRYVNLSVDDLSCFFGEGKKFIIPRVSFDEYLRICGKSVEEQKVA